MNANIRRYLRGSAFIGGLLVVCPPVAFIVTLLLSPLRSRAEATCGIEAAGHSGPADWCFEIQETLCRIHSRGSPARPAADARNRHGAAQTGRGEQTFIPCVADLLAPCRLLRLGHIRANVALRQRLPCERRRLGGKRLRRPGLLARNI